MDAGIEDLLAAGRHARAFDLVVPAYKDRVFRLAYSILKERAAAEDATQETLVRVWKALPGFDGGPSSAPGSTRSPATPA